MTDHAEIIRNVLREPLAGTLSREFAAEALLHLEAENQRLRHSLEGWLLFVKEVCADPESSAHIAADEELAALTIEATT